MPKRTICIQNPAKLSIDHSSLVISQQETYCAIPLEDIWVLVLESQQATLTTATLSRLADGGIGVLVCGGNHMPNSLSLPLGAHSRHAAIVEHQLSLTKPFKKQVWMKIIKQKISNQAKVMEILGHDPTKLKQYAKEVLSDDSTGREAVAAAEYFKQILPIGSRREGPYAALLDYGYAILRAGIGRAAVSNGWLVSQGVHHASDLNAFNLVDDFIEPFRPLVDLMILQNCQEPTLTTQNKQILASVFENNVLMENRITNVQAAIEQTFESFKESVLNKDSSSLTLPDVIELCNVNPE